MLPNSALEATAPLDGTISVRSPEGVLLSASLADPIRRMWALLIDCLLIGIFLFGAALLLSLIGGRLALGLYFLLFFITVWGYFFLGEAFFNGKTFGKKCCGIAVRMQDLTPLTISAALWRNVLRYVDFLPSCFGVGIIFILSTDKHQRLGDWMAGTVVVQLERALQPARLALDVPPLAPPFPLSFTDRLTLLDFAHYVQRTTPERAAEIAAPFALPQEDLAVTVARLQGYACYLEQSGG